MVERRRQDEYIGTLVNTWIAAGGRALGVKAGTAYVDVGTLHGYRAAVGLLGEAAASGQNSELGARVVIGWPAWPADHA